MTKLVLVDFKTMDRLLRQLGFEEVRQKGSHVFYRHDDGRTTTFPIIPAGTWLAPCCGRYFVKSS